MAESQIGLISNLDKPDAPKVVRGFWEECEQRGLNVAAESGTARIAGRRSELSSADLARTCSLLVVFGGDGTILNVLNQLQDGVKPVFGINIGSLGFLTCVTSKDWKQAVDCIVDGKYELSMRSLLLVELLGPDGATTVSDTALNDMVVSRGQFSQLVRLRTVIDGEFFTIYNADGLVAATPTGSTAYSLSAGGPILTPHCGAMVLTPICPHVLTNRSAIVNDDSVVEIDSPVEGQTVHVNVDGKDLGPLPEGGRVRLSKAEFSLPLAMLPGTSFFEVLRQKLKWTGTNI